MVVPLQPQRLAARTAQWGRRGLARQQVAWGARGVERITCWLHVLHACLSGLTISWCSAEWLVVGNRRGSTPEEGECNEMNA